VTSAASPNLNSKLTCFKCKQPGHTRRFCPLNSQSAEKHVNACGAPVVSPDTQECLSSVSYESYRDFVTLQYITVSIDEIQKAKNISSDRPDRYIKALEDSGSQLCVVKSSLVESVVLPKVGTVCLRGIVGAPVMADLVKLHISLVNDSTGCKTSLPVMCAVCPDLNEDMILTTAFVNQLRCSTGVNSVCTAQTSDACGNINCSDRSDSVANTGDNSLDSETVKSSNNDCVGLVDKTSVTTQMFLKDQQSDETLEACWEKAKQNKDGFEMRNGLLYHVENVDCIGEKCVQLCLPAQRRKAVIELAHCTLGCHQACRRTRDRIRLSFYWPTLTKDVRNFCETCEVCQKSSRQTVWDRTPITAVPRAQYAFQEFYVDCGGPLFPNQKTSAYNYFIVLVDSATSFPFVYPLRALTAKNIADALIKTLSLTGVPEAVIWDNASPHRSELMHELMKHIGCTPRFSTPFHPEGHAMVERMVSTVKTMIGKVAADKPKQWHTYLDFIVWAIRESVNESLGVAPWTLVFSRLPRGPLSILKETWEGAVDPPLKSGEKHSCVFA